MTMLKKVLKNTSTPEKRLAMQDYGMIMHRLDRGHCLYYILIAGVCNGDNEYTIKEYIDSSAGRVWRDDNFVARVQHYIKWLAVQRYATLRNQHTIENTFFTNKSDLNCCLAWLRHALTRINCYQVRIFGALLFDMCTVQEIMEAGNDKNQRLQDAEVSGAWAEPFEMKLEFFEAGNLQRSMQSKSAWCWPTFAPPSAMQWLMRVLELPSEQCAWRHHIMAGLQSEEEAHAEKLSWWKFWRGMERWCPLEQYATKKAAKAARAGWEEQRQRVAQLRMLLIQYM